MNKNYIYIRISFTKLLKIFLGGLIVFNSTIIGNFSSLEAQAHEDANSNPCSNEKKYYSRNPNNADIRGPEITDFTDINEGHYAIDELTPFEVKHFSFMATEDTIEFLQNQGQANESKYKEDNVYHIQTSSNSEIEIHLFRRKCNGVIEEIYNDSSSGSGGNALIKADELNKHLEKDHYYLIQVHSKDLNKSSRFSLRVIPPSGLYNPNAPTTPGRYTVPDFNIYHGYANPVKGISEGTLITNNAYNFMSELYPLPNRNNGLYHMGVDLVDIINSPVFAIADGRVIYRENDCKLDHQDSLNSNVSRVFIEQYKGNTHKSSDEFLTMYVHTRPIDLSNNLVRAMTYTGCNGNSSFASFEVRAGDLIGFTTRYQNPDHLHFEIGDSSGNEGVNAFWGVTTLNNLSAYMGKFDPLTYFAIYRGTVEPLVFNTTAEMASLINKNIMVAEPDSRDLDTNQTLTEDREYPDLNITKLEALSLIVKAIEETSSINLNGLDELPSLFFSDLKRKGYIENINNTGTNSSAGAIDAADTGDLTSPEINIINKATRLGLIREITNVNGSPTAPIKLNPHRFINRQEFLYMVTKAYENFLNQNISTTNNSSFLDLPSDSSYSEAIIKADNKNILSEAKTYQWTKINPNNPVPRHRAALWIKNFIDEIDTTPHLCPDQVDGDQGAGDSGSTSTPFLFAFNYIGRALAAPTGCSGNNPPPNQAPTAEININSQNNLTVSFDGSSSIDSDGTISTYNWDFGDSTSSLLISPNHTFQSTGDYQVGLTVIDNDGASHTDSLLVIASNQNSGGNPPPSSTPELMSITPSSAILGTETFFTVTGSNMPSQVKTFIDQCTNYDSSSLRNVINNSVQFSCTPSFGDGSLSLTIKDSNNSEIFDANDNSLSVDFIYPSGNLEEVYDISLISNNNLNSTSEIRPIKVQLGQTIELAAHGRNLSSSINLALDTCSGTGANPVLADKIAGANETNEKHFECTIDGNATEGLHSGEIRSDSSSTAIVISTFQIEYSNPNPASPPPSATIIDINPKTAIRGSRSTFTFSGTDLQNANLIIEISNCDSQQAESVSDPNTEKAISCVPNISGNQTATVSLDANTAAIFTETITVSDPPLAKIALNVEPKNVIIGQSIDFVVYNSINNADINFSLEDCPQALKVSNTLDTETHRCTPQGLAGVKQLTITDNTGARDPYNLTINFTALTDDGNGDPNNPKTVSENIQEDANIHAIAASDYFNFTAPRTASFKFDVIGIDARLELRDSNANKIGQNANGSNFIIKSLVQGQTYKLRLGVAEDNSTGSYSLLITEVTDPITAILSNPEDIPNFTEDFTIPFYHQIITAGSRFLSSPGDAKAFKFITGFNAQYNLSLLADTNNGDFEVQLFDSNQNHIRTDFGDNINYDFSSNAGNIYYAVITRLGGEDAYSFLVSELLTLKDPNTPDDHSDFPLNATAINVDFHINPGPGEAGVIAGPADVDWFKFTLNQAAQVKIYTEDAPAVHSNQTNHPENLRGTLYSVNDLSNPITLSSSKGDGQGNQIGANFEINRLFNSLNLSAGDYLLKIDHSKEKGISAYKVFATTTTNLMDDAGSDLSSGTPYNGQETSGRIEVTGDVDCHILKPKYTKTYTVKLNDVNFDAQLQFAPIAQTPGAIGRSPSKDSGGGPNGYIDFTGQGDTVGYFIGTLLGSQTYCLNVLARDRSPFPSTSIGDYKISTEAPPNTIDFIADDDVADIFELARGISLNTVNSSDLRIPGDIDMENLANPAPGFYQIESSPQFAHRDAYNNFLPATNNTPFYAEYKIYQGNTTTNTLISTLTPNSINGGLSNRVHIAQTDNLYIAASHASLSGPQSFTLRYDDLADTTLELSQQSETLEINQIRDQALNRTNDVDLLEFTVATDGKYRIRTNSTAIKLELSPSTSAANIEDFDLQVSNSSTAYNRFIEADLLSGVNYTLKAFSNSLTSIDPASPFNYKLELTISPDEHANTYHNATVLSSTQSASGVLDHGPNVISPDSDFFKLDITDDNFYDLADSQGSTIRKLYKWKSATQDIELVQTYDDQTGFDHKYLLASEDYYLEVTTVDNNQGLNYSVSLDVWTAINDDVSNIVNQATQLAISFPPSVFNGSIEYEEDFEWFKLTIDNSNFLNANYEFKLSGDEGVRLEFFDNANPPQPYSTNSQFSLEIAAGSSLASQSFALLDGEYYLKVFHQDRLVKNKSYSITINQPDDHYDTVSPLVHPNSPEFNVIKNLDSNQINLLNRSDDQDAIKFFAQGWYRLQSHGDLNLRASVYLEASTPNTDGSYNRNLILSDDAHSGIDDNFEFVQYFDGTHFLKVSSPTNDLGSYTISLDPVPLSEIDDHGNNASEASPVGPFTSIPGNLETINDVDYFSYDVESYYKPFSIEADRPFVVKDAYNNTRYYGAQSYGVGPYKATNIRLNPGKCYIVFSGFSSTYSFIVSSQDTNLNSVYSPDYSFTAKQKLTIDSPITSYFEINNDTDTFMLEASAITEDGYYSFVTEDVAQPLDASQTNSKFIAKFYNATKQLLESFNNSSTDSHLSITKYLFAGQKHYIEMIETSTNQIPAAYRLKLASTGAPSYTDDQVLALDTLETKNIDGTGKIQVLKFTTSTDGSYQIKVNSQNAFNFALNLIDSSQYSLYKVTGFGSSVSFYKDLSPNTTYYIHIIPEFQDTVASYTAEIVEPIADDHGNDMNSATQMDAAPGINNFIKSGVISGGGGDLDYFWFQSTSTGFHKVKLVSSATGTGFQAYNSGGSYKGNSVYQNVNGEHAYLLDLYVVAGTKYYLKVYGYLNLDYVMTVDSLVP